jgi:lipopolysaccharide/colanic/teichoic acid biosynthesis glycosyltransferase
VVAIPGSTVRIWPVLLDSRPEYLRLAGADASLLLAPLGTGLVIDYLRAALQPITRNAPIVLRPGTADPDYVERISDAYPSAIVTGTSDERIEAFLPHEPSDALLIVDPRCLPVEELNLSELVRHFMSEVRAAHHLVAFEAPIAGTKERVSFDAAGKVRGIIRHYELATWPFIAGVPASILPAASGVLTEGFLPASLGELRQTLVMRGVPGRDVPIEGTSLDLGLEADLLAANELHVTRSMGTGTGSPILVGAGHAIDATARLIGPVIVQAGARIDKDATILGPTVIGANVHVQAGAVVAHAVIGTGYSVQAGEIVRDRACFGQPATAVTARPLVRFPSSGARAARVELEWQKSSAPGPALGRRISLRLKRALDVTAAAVTLLVFSPLIALAALLVRLDSKGPIFYGDKREGRDGRAFKCWKFRTMAVGADAVQKDLKTTSRIDGPHFKLDRDPRVTRIGRILRTSNLDELPQLINVLVGDMSLVGPRPSPFRENQVCVPWREARLSVTPGITGLWQVCRHDRDAGDFHQWIEYDLLYVQHFSFWLDLKILAATLFTLGGKTGHASPGWMVPTKPVAAYLAASTSSSEPDKQELAS